MKKYLTPLALAATVLTSQGAAIHSGLLSYWAFDGNYNDTAGSIAGNASTVADNGTAGSAVAMTAGGPLGNYGDFGRTGLGLQNVVAVPTSADVDAAGESLTISLWFRVDGLDQGWQAAIGQGEGSAYRIARRSNENGLGYAGGTGDIPNAAGVTPNVNDNLWHHVTAITEAGVSTRLWIDGVLIGTSAGAPTLTNNLSTQLFIGGNPQGNAGDATVTQYRPWNGGIDDVALWNRALTSAEVGEVYSAGLAGTSLGSIGTVPEPSTGLLGLLGLGLLARRRR